jgi:4-amino-4-deoxy-L-arabinose transferase-like glycosyltransferase
MKFIIKIFNKIKIIYILILLFFLLNLFTLSDFPFVHSDEAWLSGLSRNILQTKDFTVTESFFDLMPRNPHAVKIFFHSLQIVFIKIFNYTIFSVRLISLTAAAISLYLFYKINILNTNSNILSILGTLLIALDIHYIYTAHLARQEIILVLIFLAAFYYLISNMLSGPDEYKVFRTYNKNSLFNNSSIKKDIILALILSIGMGIHPNIFIISLPFIIIYTYELLFNKKIKLKNYAAFGATLTINALLFVLLSFKFDSNFLSNYAQYGKSLGVLNSTAVKLDSLDYFYKKIFYRVSGTYYIPPVKIQLIIFALVMLIALINLLVKKKKIDLYLILSIIGINLGYVIIGRYNQTSIIFIFPVFYILIISIISDLSNFSLKSAYTVFSILIILIAANTTFFLYNDNFNNYQAYLNNISQVVDKDDRVLANLNSEYYFKNGNLFDYRNLAYLDENNLNFAEYIEKNDIDYIIYPEEMDFIYNSRPQWNIIYGNLYPYYNNMQKFINNNTKLVYEFTDSTYAMRIVSYIGKKNWYVKIYKVIKTK